MHSKLDPKPPLELVCSKPGCGKTFKYRSKLQRHENSHAKLDSVEAFCSDCKKYFKNKQCLKEHKRSCHRYITCDQCGTKQLKKNIKRHMRKHEGPSSSERIKCSFEGCRLTFSNTSNLNKHIKVVHLEQKPFGCAGCGLRFAYKHVRYKHETSTCKGNFEESDEELQFRSRPRGGRGKRVIETVMRKRVRSSSTQ